MSTFRAKKSLGQNFLKDPYYLDKIVDSARITSHDLVLEIGPGLGHLTRVLAARAGRVLALELDERLIPLLRKDFAECRNVEIVQADALEYPYAGLSDKWKVVANLPYYLSTPIIQKLLNNRERFDTLTLMLQKEVADRIASPPGVKEYGYLSVLVQLYAEPHIEFLVPAGAFTPRPDVDSAVITLALRGSPAVSLRDEGSFLRVVKAAFSQRRKTLRNSLKQLDVSKEKMEAVLDRTGIDLGRRAETLNVEEFARLADFLLF
ncbi:MAG TPA: 16S rRNA (adenine(1518)-N(6)/adenine(1519)-N(6))-dimethyltransferase RsmA [Nitrospirota bacterium]|nr:16S rRNA (adenine(1518)-N(6)/adenine(1519)-N(6))-dimethyltransferase RsmA [Nitrospirota bacterium]